MAIITHRTSKNARYTDVLEYYSFRHKEDPETGHYEPLLDEFGLMQERTNYAVAYINAMGEEEAPELWAGACMRTNITHGKNRDESDRKSHEYIISHTEEESKHLTDEELMEEGKAFARKCLPGHDCLIAVHRDTENSHVHISCNSVRAVQREEESWMMKDKSGKTLACEMEAGGKHQDSPQFMRHRNEWLLNYCREHGFEEKDNMAIADARRAARHGSKNEQMKTALLEVASRSKSAKELIQLMKQDYDMTVKWRGNTISVVYPGDEKAVRLRTLGLETADITRRLQGEKYAFTEEAKAEQIQKEVAEAEKKKYIEWVRERRERNNAAAEEAVARAEYVLAMEMKGRGEKYVKSDFQDLNALIRQTAYINSTLQMEKEKVDRLLGRWEQYNDISLSDRERQQHGGYVQWCGCDPASALELEELRAERETIEAQQGHAVALREALLSTAEQWRGRNDLTYSESNLEWTKNREKQLKQQLKYIRESKNHMYKIAFNCERAAKRKTYYSEEAWAKVDKFDALHMQKLKQEYEIKQKIKEVKKQKKEAKKKVRQAKKTLKEVSKTDITKSDNWENR